MNIFNEIISTQYKLPSHRTYYTCIEKGQRNICQRGIVPVKQPSLVDYYLNKLDVNFSKPTYKHVCVFASTNLDNHFMSKYPGHTVVESLEDTLKTNEPTKPFTHRWF